MHDGHEKSRTAMKNTKMAMKKSKMAMKKSKIATKKSKNIDCDGATLTKSSNLIQQHKLIFKL